MKFPLLISAALFFLPGCQSKSQETTAAVQVNTQEITWTPTIEEALTLAKKQNKLVFVECYSPTCPVCQTMEPLFKNPEVAKFYNENFISYKLDVGNQEQVAFLNQKNIFLPSFPQFLFFNSDGQLVHQGDVVNTVASINGVAKLALDPAKRASSYSERMAKGESSVEFLSAYANYALVAKDTVANQAAANRLFEIYPKDKISSQQSWQLTKKCVRDIDNGFAKYWFDHVPQAAAYEKSEGHEGLQNNILGAIIQASLYSPKGLQYTSSQLARVKTLMGKAGAGEYADGVTWEYEVRALVRENKAPQALPVGARMYEKYKQNPPSVIYIAKVFNDLYPNASYVAQVKPWMNAVKPLVQADKEWADFYLEWARMHQKAGDLTEARKAGEQAKTYASKANIPLDRFMKFLQTI